MVSPTYGVKGLTSLLPTDNVDRNLEWTRDEHLRSLSR